MMQHELTDGRLWFVYKSEPGHGPEHLDALYRMPGYRVARRWQLLKAFPKLRDMPREVENSEIGRPEIPGAAQEARELHEGGMPVSQIAYRMGRRKATIEKWLAE